MMDRINGQIVVGVDGSAESRTALAYALHDAARRGVGVEVVSAFDPVPSWAYGYGLPASAETPAELREAVLKETQQLVEEVVAGLGAAAGSVPTHVEALVGNAAQVLTDRAQGAAELVVGHRGRGGFARLMLGSVALHCVQHAACSVVVVRAQPEPHTE